MSAPDASPDSGDIDWVALGVTVLVTVVGVAIVAVPALSEAVKAVADVLEKAQDADVQRS